MASMSNRFEEPRGSRWPDERMSGYGELEDLPKALDAERTGDSETLVDQGLRLNRAFMSINDPLVREAIINLAVEAANQSADDSRLPPIYG
jgi:hypothetical protein